MSRIRVLIADDHAVLRAGLKLLIGAEPDMEVVGEAADGPEAVRRAHTTVPDVVLLDLSMPGGRGTQTIEELVRRAPTAASPPHVLVLTMHDDAASMQAALLAGASGYIVKKAADIELLTAIRAVYRGRTFVDLTRPGEEARSPGNRPDSRNSPPGGQPKPLSPREGEVLRLLAQGHTYREAADQLGVSVKTIETHRKRLADKLGLKSRAQLFRFAIDVGLLEGE
jgi:DNA-binding NarL/FixJ family response regulator